MKVIKKSTAMEYIVNAAKKLSTDKNTNIYYEEEAIYSDVYNRITTLFELNVISKEDCDILCAECSKIIYYDWNETKKTLPEYGKLVKIYCKGKYYFARREIGFMKGRDIDVFEDDEFYYHKVEDVLQWVYVEEED